MEIIYSHTRPALRKRKSKQGAVNRNPDESFEGLPGENRASNTRLDTYTLQCRWRASSSGKLHGRVRFAHLGTNEPLICDGLAGLRHLSAVCNCACWDNVDRVVEVVAEDDIQNVSRNCKQPWACIQSCILKPRMSTAYAWTTSVMHSTSLCSEG